MAIAEETAGNPNLPNKRQNAGGSKVIAIDTTSTCVAADISADDRRCKNEDSCPIYKLSNDELNLIFVYVDLLRALLIDSIESILKHLEMKY